MALHFNPNTAISEIIEYFLHNGVKKDGFCTDLVKHGLKKLIREREVRIVAVNVPTTWQHLASKPNEFDARMFGAINDMLMDMLAAIARRDYEQRRQRQAQGIEKAKAAGKYRGRQADKARYAAINRLLASGSSWSVVQKTVGCSRSTISKAVRHARCIESASASNEMSSKTEAARA